MHPPLHLAGAWASLQNMPSKAWGRHALGEQSSNWNGREMMKILFTSVGVGGGFYNCFESFRFWCHVIFGLVGYGFHGRSVKASLALRKMASL